MTTATTTNSITRQVDENGEIFIGARAQALALRSKIENQALLTMVMRVLADNELQDVTQEADLLLKYAFEDADVLEQPILLGTVLAFYGTDVKDKVNPAHKTELSATGLTEAQFNYWSEKLQPQVVRLRLVVSAYDPGASFSLQAVGLLVSQFLKGIKGREGRIAALALVLKSNLTPFVVPPAIERVSTEALNELADPVMPVCEELVGIIKQKSTSVWDILSYTEALARQAELSPEQAKAVLCCALGMLLDAQVIRFQPTIALVCSGHTTAKPEQGATDYTNTDKTTE